MERWFEFRMSPAEFDYFRRYVKGRTVAEIARETGVRFKTVDNALAKIRARLRVKNRRDSLLVAMAIGMVERCPCCDCRLPSFRPELACGPPVGVIGKLSKTGRVVEVPDLDARKSG